MDAGTKKFAAQVGGHAGVSTSEDGSLLIKPTLPREISFYERLASDPVFASLRPHAPKFYGTLKFEGKVEDGNLEALQEAPAPKEGKDSIKLENLTQRFLKPNILDIKLGTVLYDESEASEEKRARMILDAKNTTSFETGMKLTGFQTYNTATGEPVPVPRAYGKSLKVSDLPDGIASFFPVHSEQLPQGLPKEQLLPILGVIRKHVAAIREVYAQLEIRMVGASFLIIYESDFERARQGTALLEEGEGEGGGGGGGEDSTKPGPPCLVKLIDFAHARMLPGEGPDEGVLLGMDTTLKLLDGRIAQIKLS